PYTMEEPRIDPSNWPSHVCTKERDGRDSANGFNHITKVEAQAEQRAFIATIMAKCIKYMVGFSSNRAPKRRTAGVTAAQGNQVSAKVTNRAAQLWCIP